MLTKLNGDRLRVTIVLTQICACAKSMAASANRIARTYQTRSKNRPVEDRLLKRSVSLY
jgi:hypothetical protein